MAFPGAPCELARMSAVHPPQRKFLGILLIIATVACFACGDNGAKWLNSYVSPGLIVGVRYIFSFVVVALLLRPWNKPARFKTRKLPLQILRGALMLGATACGWTGLHYVSVVQGTSIVFAAPLVIASLAGPMLGEWPGWRRALAILVGFAGVLVITRPGSSGALPIQALFLVATAIQNGILALITRKLAAYDDSETTMFYSTLVGAILVLPVYFFIESPPSDLSVWIVLLLVASFGTAAHWFLVVAHKYAPASLLAPFIYTQIIFAGAISFVVFGNVPDRWTIMGALIIVASGLYILHRERIRHVPPSEQISG
jgi:drug/metabolite transporter (DMT)-like permease